MPLSEFDTDRSADLVSNRPLSLPLSAIESARTEPVRRAVFAHAKIVHIMEGRASVETETGAYELVAGAVLTLGAGQWCSMRPLPHIRTWNLYIDESFLRGQMSWVLPDPERVLPGFHPDRWDGRALLLLPGIALCVRMG